MKKGLFLSLIAAVALLASCNKTLPNPEQLSVNPNPLVKVGNKVDAEIVGTFPEKKFAKKGVLVVTPVLKFEGQEYWASPTPMLVKKQKRMARPLTTAKVASTARTALSTMFPLCANRSSIFASRHV